MIQEGEHQQLDFKFEISDSKKIARTLSAFSNTKGGKLLIGVKDNGKIAGVMSEEEFYMLDAAANMYCRPAVKFLLDEWEIEGKQILEVTIPESPDKPILAPDKNGRFMVYVRIKDQNLLANKVLLRVLKKEKSGKGTFIEFTPKEEVLLGYLRQQELITFTKAMRLIRSGKYATENLLVKLLSLKIIKLVLTEQGNYYTLHTDPETGSVTNKQFFSSETA
ncbi:MAG: ATP-binding protein [Bacteroidales bacterium]|nr:ATP-binding protein [Bacteroidales bacterium]